MNTANSISCLFPLTKKGINFSSHSYMFRHYRVIPRQPVINTLPSYTSI